MDLETLACNNCGAPIDVPPNANFLRCAHCGSQLAVRRTASAHYTEVLDQIGERTERMSEDLETIRLQNELEQVDREWAAEREQYMIEDRRGSKSAPTGINMVGVVVGSVVTILFLLFWISMISSMGNRPGPAGPFPRSEPFPGSNPIGSSDPFSSVGTVMSLFGVIVLMLIVAGLVIAFAKSGKYAEAEQRYLKRRRELRERLRRKG